MAANKSEKEQPIIVVKKIKKGGGGHHGGAWKVAYADFVTAMMAFFLLMWLLNVTTEDQKQAISNYFDPTAPKISDSRSGSGGVLSGTSVAAKGAMSDNVSPITPSPTPDTDIRGEKRGDTLKGASQDKEEPPGRSDATAEGGEDRKAAEMRRREEARFKAAEDALRAAIESVPELQALRDNLLIDQTPEGLRIQIVDKDGQPMFPLGSSEMYQEMKIMLTQVTKVVERLPNAVSIRGHTDAATFQNSRFSNWELSAERANASRRVMLENGLNPERVANVQGRAATTPLYPDNPQDPRNRRISIVLLRDTDPLGRMGAGEGGEIEGGYYGTDGLKPRELPPRDKGVIHFP